MDNPSSISYYCIMYDAFVIDEGLYTEDVTYFARDVESVILFLKQLEENTNIAYKELFVTRRTGWPSLINKNFIADKRFVPLDQWIDVPFERAINPSLETSAIRFLYKDFPAVEEPSVDYVESLIGTYFENWENSQLVLESNFCHSNDFPVFLIKSFLPEWDTETSGEILTGHFRIAVVERELGIIKEINRSAIEASVSLFNLCGFMHAILLKQAEGHISPYGNYCNPGDPYEFSTFVLFCFRPSSNPDILIYDDLSLYYNKADIPERINKWKQWLRADRNLTDALLAELTRIDVRSSNINYIGSVYSFNREGLAALWRKEAAALRSKIDNSV